MRRVPRQKPGYLLAEMVVYLGLLVLMGALAMEILASTLRTWRNSAATLNQEMAFDLALNRMRADVWSASKIELSDPHRLVLHFPSQPDVTWDSDETHISRAASADSSRHTWDAPGKLTFSADGARVMLHVAGSADAPDADLALVSQLLLLDGRPQ